MCYTVLLGSQRWFARSLEPQQDLLCWLLCETILKINEKQISGIRQSCHIKKYHIYVAVHGFNSSWLTYLLAISPVLKKTCSATCKLSHSGWQTLVHSGVYRNDMSATHPVHIRNIFFPSRQPRLIFPCKAPHLLLFHWFLTLSPAPCAEELPDLSEWYIQDWKSLLIWLFLVDHTSEQC